MAIFKIYTRFLSENFSKNKNYFINSILDKLCTKQQYLGSILNYINILELSFMFSCVVS